MDNVLQAGPAQSQRCSEVDCVTPNWVTQSLHYPGKGLRKPRGLLQLQRYLLDLLSPAVKMPLPDLLLLLPPCRKIFLQLIVGDLA